jgi:hypothetical protein
MNLELFKDLRLYWAYGSNMAPSSLTEKGLKLRVVGIGYLDHHRLMFNKISKADPSVGFANVVPFWGKRVYGTIYDMANEKEGTQRYMPKATDAERLNALGVIQENLTILDKKEGYPHHYQRTGVSILKADVDQRFNCFTYIATPEMTSASGNLMVTDKYIGKISEGLGVSGLTEHSEETRGYVMETMETMKIWRQQ